TIVQVKGEVMKAPHEYFFVDPTPPTVATLTIPGAHPTLVNDDAVPSLSIDDIRLNEGNIGTSAATLTVKLSAPSAQPITVKWSTADGTASPPSDYSPANGTLTFNPGVTSQTITVLVKRDV